SLIQSSLVININEPIQVKNNLKICRFTPNSEKKIDPIIKVNTILNFERGFISYEKKPNIIVPTKDTSIKTKQIKKEIKPKSVTFKTKPIIRKLPKHFMEEHFGILNIIEKEPINHI